MKNLLIALLLLGSVVSGTAFAASQCCGGNQPCCEHQAACCK